MTQAAWHVGQGRGLPVISLGYPHQQLQPMLERLRVFLHECGLKSSAVAQVSVHPNLILTDIFGSGSTQRSLRTFVRVHQIGTSLQTLPRSTNPPPLSKCQAEQRQMEEHPTLLLAFPRSQRSTKVRQSPGRTPGTPG